MLITIEELINIMVLYGKSKITGVLHVGGHECEELEYYFRLGVDPDKIYWIEAIDAKVEECKKGG